VGSALDELAALILGTSTYSMSKIYRARPHQSASGGAG